MYFNEIEPTTVELGESEGKSKYYSKQVSSVRFKNAKHSRIQSDFDHVSYTILARLKTIGSLFQEISCKMTVSRGCQY